MSDELSSVHQKIARGQAKDEDRRRAEVLKLKMAERLMDAKLDDVFEVSEPLGPMPRGARILQSLTCEACGEAVMESRTRRFAGQTLCLPCFNALEQKV
jgi:formylmethanofuran dehydrogenase subunit E